MFDKGNDSAAGWGHEVLMIFLDKKTVELKKLTRIIRPFDRRGFFVFIPNALWRKIFTTSPEVIPKRDDLSRRKTRERITHTGRKLSVHLSSAVLANGLAWKQYSRCFPLATPFRKRNRTPSITQLITLHCICAPVIHAGPIIVYGTRPNR